MGLKAYGDIFIKKGDIDAGNTVNTDLLIVGSGLGGLWSAWSAMNEGVKDVAVVDKCSIGESSQSKMSAGATIYCTKRKLHDSWLKELAELQSYLSRQDMMSSMLIESEEILHQQKQWGLWYENMPWGSPMMQVGGTKKIKMHVLPRYKNMGGGAAIVNTIKDRAIEEGAKFYSKIMIARLLEKNGVVYGAIGIDRKSGEIIRFHSKAVIIATADCSFGNTGCIGHATGDGYSLAYDVGARLTNMEFWGSNTGSPDYSFESISDTAASFGCKFYDKQGNTFCHKYSKDGDKAIPFKIAQAMADEVDSYNNAPFYFGMNKFAWIAGYNMVLKKKMNGYVTEMFKGLEQNDIDVFKRPIEWTPVMRTIRGGVRTNIDGMSDVRGLFAVGTAQSIDPNGINGISTLRAMWSGKRAGVAVAKYIKESACEQKVNSEKTNDIIENITKNEKTNGTMMPNEYLAELQNVMFPYNVSLKKSNATLAKALERVKELRDEVGRKCRVRDTHELVQSIELENMLKVAELYLSASIERKETRGEHYRADYPNTDNANWLRWINLSRADNGQMLIETERVPIEQYPIKEGKRD